MRSDFGRECPFMKRGLMLELDRRPELSRLRLVGVVLGLCLCESVAALSLYDIIELSRSGYGDEEIARLITVTEARFELDVDSLRTLMVAGVSEPVIGEMLQAGDRSLTEGQRTRPVSEVRTNLADTTVNDILQLYQTGLSEATILDFVRHLNECIPFSVDHTLQMAEAGMSQAFVSVLDILMVDCRDRERIAESRLDYNVGSSLTRRANLLSIYDDHYYRTSYYRTRSYPLVIDLYQPSPQQYQGHLIEVQGPEREVVHHVTAEVDVIDHHHHEVVRDHGRAQVRDFSEHQHVGVSLAEHEAIHPEHSAAVSIDSRVTHRVNDHATPAPQVSSSRFSTINRRTERRYVEFGRRSVASGSNSATTVSSSTRGGGISRSASSGLSVGNQRARSNSTVFTSRSSVSPGRPTNASTDIGRAAPHSAGSAAQHQSNARISGVRIRR